MAGKTYFDRLTERLGTLRRRATDQPPPVVVPPAAIAAEAAPAPAPDVAPVSARAALERVINERRGKVVFQPIVDLATRQVYSYEALARSLEPTFKGPLELFKAAVQERLVGQLGRLMRQLAIDGCTTHPLFINVHPNEFDEGWLVRPDEALFWHEHQVYLEVTEAVPLSHFEQCHSVLKEIRSKGVKLAIDDLGAGYSNLRYIVELAPEIVKLDMELVQGVARHERQRKLVRAFARLCDDLGSKLVAEGIETEEDFHAILDAGVHLGQGYLLARPDNPPPEFKWPEDTRHR